MASIVVSVRITLSIKPAVEIEIPVKFELFRRVQHLHILDVMEWGNGAGSSYPERYGNSEHYGGCDPAYSDPFGENSETGATVHLKGPLPPFTQSPGNGRVECILIVLQLSNDFFQKITMGFIFAHGSNSSSSSRRVCIAREVWVLTLPSEHPMARAVPATSSSSR